MKVQIRIEVAAAVPEQADLFGLADALMAQLVAQGAIDPSTDVDGSAGCIGLEFVVTAADVEEAGRLALRTVEETFAAVGTGDADSARVVVPSNPVASIRHSEQTVLIGT